MYEFSYNVIDSTPVIADAPAGLALEAVTVASAPSGLTLEAILVPADAPSGLTLDAVTVADAPTGLDLELVAIANAPTNLTLESITVPADAPAGLTLEAVTVASAPSGLTLEAILVVAESPTDLALNAVTVADAPTNLTLSEVEILLRDSFTDVDGTVLASHTPEIDTVGSGWIGGGEILGNQAANISSNYFTARIDSGQSDVEVSATFILPSDTNLARLYLRSNGTDYIEIIVSRVAGDFTTTVRKQDSGVSTLLSAGVTSVPEISGQIDISGTVDSSNQIKVYMDGALKHTVATALNSSETHHGFHLNDSSNNIRLDNFEIKSFT